MKYLCRCSAMLALVFASQSSTADEPKPDDAYQSVWSDVSDLIRRREYASAGDVLDTLADDPNMQLLSKVIESDKKVIAELQKLHRLVLELAAILPEGTEVDISGTKMTLVRFESDPKGDSLILRPPSSAVEQKKAIASLPPDTWVKLAEAKLDNLDHRDLTLGVFFGFDQSADVKAARRLMNEAAETGEDVALWLSRLEEAETKRKQTKSAEKEPVIVGTWAHQVKKNGKIVKRQTFELYSNGRINSPDSVATWEKKGRLLILKWPDPEAPGGEWQDVCNLLASGKAYVGKNQRGFTLHGVKIDNKEPGKK